MPSPLKKAAIFLEKSRGVSCTRQERIDKTVQLTALLLESTRKEQHHSENKRAAWMAHMVQDPRGRMFMTEMTDQCFRSNSNSRTTSQLLFLIKKWGIPSFLQLREKIQFLIFLALGGLWPGFFIPFIRKNIKKEMSHVLLPEDPKLQADYFRKSRKEHVRINLNHLGEAILSEEEAGRRLELYLEDLASPHIEYISIKISTLFSQINTVAFSETIEILAERLRALYRVSESHFFRRENGIEVKKFVNLDMEEYKDLDLTLAVFQKVLSESEFLQTEAGIVLQSYLPDAFGAQQTLTKWAQERLKRGGAPIKLRIVKGANLAMEAVESSLRNWKQAPFQTKLETDANFRRMLEFASLPENTEAVHIGVGSHNLFDIAYALQLRSEFQIEKEMTLEMLEGMAESMQRVVKKLTGEILLYCPEVKERDYHNAVAYLVRRLDENCGEENFLRHFFALQPQNKVWKAQVELFAQGCLKIDTLSVEPRRKQNRLTERDEQDAHDFENESDTDFSLHENRAWINQIYLEWEKKKHPPIPLVINGEQITSIQEVGIDPSAPHTPLYRYNLADVPLIETALNAATLAQSEWQALPFSQQSALLANVARIFREKRGDLIGSMISDAGKTASEADVEVSEAIDFIEYYRKMGEELHHRPDLKWSPKGVVLVAPPWNFPCSIPVSGIVAALTAGNAVLFKPAPETVLVGWHLASAFWEAGISKNLLQFINCKENPVGTYLVKHPKIASVILTGATETAKTFLKIRPGLDLHAETGGKNAMIITAMADRDLALRDLIASAFGHSGQKCSACSLAILEAEVYDDPHFQNQLLEAAKSLKVASAWDKAAKITPLIHAPEGALLRGLTELEEGESWLLKPEPRPGNPNLWSPGIKWGVKPQSFTHQTELFGPVLGVMRAKDLPEAIAFANGTPYGLTSGLQSLDVREQELWREKIVAGNLYVNRTITGAIVRRQPFGGCKASGFGSGAKAGGPNYVQQFAIPAQLELPKEKGALPGALIPLIATLRAFPLTEDERQTWKISAENYAHWAKILKKAVDPSKILGQENSFYHVSLEKAYVRVEKEVKWLSLLQVIAACVICKTPLHVSTSSPLPLLPPLSGVSVKVEEEGELLEKNPRRIRLLGSPSATFLQAAAERAVIFQQREVLASGKYELLHYLREVSVSADYHRYGFIGL